MLIKYNKPTLYRVGKIRFFPGVNTVDKMAWDEVKAHPHVKQRVEEGELEVLSTGEKKGLSGYAPKKAAAIVKETFDREILKEWKSNETRALVLSAIEEQFKQVDSVKEPEKKKADLDEEEHFS